MAGGTTENNEADPRLTRALALYREHRSDLFGLARLLVANDELADFCVRAACVEMSASNELRLDCVADMRIAVLATARKQPKVVADADELPLVVFALQRLTARQREVVVLRHYAGMTEGQISRAIGVTIGSVRTHYRRGMAHLIGWLSDEAAVR